MGLIFVLGACSSSEKRNSNLLCPDSSNDLETRHVTISAKTQANALVKCFRNYLKFEENKKQEIRFCNVINVAKSGKVTYSKVFGIGKRLPKDFQMCLEQEYWMMNFSKLQLDKPVFVKFPLEFKSK